MVSSVLCDLPGQNSEVPTKHTKHTKEEIQSFVCFVGQVRFEGAWNEAGLIRTDVGID
jgi:hypothetical protein